MYVRGTHVRLPWATMFNAFGVTNPAICVEPQIEWALNGTVQSQCLKGYEADGWQNRTADRCSTRQSAGQTSLDDASQFT